MIELYESDLACLEEGDMRLSQTEGLQDKHATVAKMASLFDIYRRTSGVASPGLSVQSNQTINRRFLIKNHFACTDYKINVFGFI